MTSAMPEAVLKFGGIDVVATDMKINQSPDGMDTKVTLQLLKMVRSEVDEADDSDTTD